MADDFDFGFTAVDDAPLQPLEPSGPVTAEIPEEFKDSVMQKLYDIEARILEMDNTGMISEHKNLVEGDVAQKLRDVEDMILPLLINLKKNPEKEYIHWPNRTAIIDKQIEKIRAITRYYD